jgi:hypothetical protein
MVSGPSGGEQAQRQLGVLGHAPLVPAAHLAEGGTPDQPHGAPEDGGVALVPRRLAHREEVLVRVVETPEVVSVPPEAVVLRSLDEADPLVGKERGGVTEPVGFHLVVGVHDPDESGSRVGDRLGVVEGSGLVPGPVEQAVETQDVRVLGAEGFDRDDEGVVDRVVVDDQHLVAGVVQA